MIDMDGIRALLKRRENPGGTHYDGCEAAHIDCAAHALLDQLERCQEFNRNLTVRVGLVSDPSSTPDAQGGSDV